MIFGRLLNEVKSKNSKFKRKKVQCRHGVTSNLSITDVPGMLQVQ
jgi:hypothetical protein